MTAESNDGEAEKLTHALLHENRGQMLLRLRIPGRESLDGIRQIRDLPEPLGTLDEDVSANSVSM